MWENFVTYHLMRVVLGPLIRRSVRVLSAQSEDVSESSLLSQKMCQSPLCSVRRCVGVLSAQSALPLALHKEIFHV
jgi:hypothetical protein